MKPKDIAYIIMYPFIKLFLIITLNPKIVNKENVPKSGAFILAGTHKSYYDPLLAGMLTKRHVYFIAKKELFNNFFLRFIFNLVGVIKVDRDNHDNENAKNIAVDVLKRGEVLCIFPEGKRNKENNNIVPFRYGAVSFAYKSGKPIVPFAIVPKPKTFRYKTKVIVGEPIYIKTNDYKTETEKLEQVVKELISNYNCQ